jgi:hypothetical protein
MPLQIETQPFQFNSPVLGLSSAVFNSVSAVSLSGTFYGDGSNLTGIISVSGTPNQINTSKSGSTVTLSLPNSAVFPGDVSIIGNLTIAGSATYIDTKNLIVGDNIIYFNDNNYGSNVLDIGIVSHFSQAPLGYNHTGLIRRAGQGVPGTWTLFSGLTTEPASATNIDWNDKNIRLDSLSANLIGNVTGNADTVTNGVYTNQSYSNPSWITSLADTKITGTKFATNTLLQSTSALLTPLTTTSALTGSILSTVQSTSALLTPLTLTNTLTSQLVLNTAFGNYQTNVAATTATLLPTTTYQNTSGSFATNTLLQSTSALLTPLTTTNQLTSQLVLNTAFNNYQTNVAASTATLLPTTTYSNASGSFATNTALNAASALLTPLTTTNTLTGSLYSTLQSASALLTPLTTTNTLTSQLVLNSTLNSLSGNWQSTYSTVSSLSANWNSAYNTATAYQNISGSFATNTFLQSTSALLTPLTLTNTLTSQLVLNTAFNNYQTNVAASTATLLPTTTYQNTSGSFATNTALNAASSILLPTSIYQSASGIWQNTYNTVQSNSATSWSYQGTDLKALSGNWQSTYNTVSSLSANWNSAYNTATTYQNTSALLTPLTLTNTLTSQLVLNTAINSLTGNWNSAYNTATAYQNISGSFATNTLLQSTSALLTPLTLTNTLTSQLVLNTAINSLTGNWNSAYNTATAYQNISGSFATNTLLQSTSALLTPLTLTNTLTSQLVLNTAINSLTGNWNSAYASTTALNTNFSKLSTQAYTYNTSTSSVVPSIFKNTNSGVYNIILGGANNSTLGSSNALLNTFSSTVTAVTGYCDASGAGATFGTPPYISTNNIIGGGNNNRIYGCAIATGYYDTGSCTAIPIAGCSIVKSNSIINGCNNLITQPKSTVSSNYTPATYSGTVSILGNTIINGCSNNIGSCYSTITNGLSNIACIGGNHAFIGSGICNTTSGIYNIVGAGRCNTSSGNYSSIINGACNIASSSYSTIVGGCKNNTNGLANTFILGSNIKASCANFTYVNNLSSGGKLYGDGTNITNVQNIIFTTQDTSSAYAPIFRNIKPACYSNSNIDSGYYSSIITAGTNNCLCGGATYGSSGFYGNNHIIIGGNSNLICHTDFCGSAGFDYNTIGNGGSNKIIGTSSGYYNGQICHWVGSYYGSSNNSIINGSCNVIKAVGITSSGTYLNNYSSIINGVCNCIQTGTSNDASYSSIIGGCKNSIYGTYNTIAGGCNNALSGTNSFILGSNIKTNISNYTLVNNLSSQGILGGNNLTLANATLSSTLINPLTAGPLLILNINGVNRAIQLWNFTT